MEITVRHNRKTYDFLLGSKARTNILYGSAGSGKSWSIAQYLLFEKLFKEKNIRILVVRKTTPALKKSAWLLMNDLIRHYKLPIDSINLSELIIRVGGNEMYFTSIDDPEKLKSFEKINYIWSEESTELSHIDYMQLHIRCRGENTNGINQLYFSFNPIDEMSFLKPITVNPPKRTAIHHSTYLDNEFNEPEYIEELERLIDHDETYYKIYTLGLWATPTNIIYSNWDVVDDMPEQFDDTYWGLDFGYSCNEAALVEIKMAGKEYWIQEWLYKTGLTNPQLIEHLGNVITDRSQMIIADCAEPKSIQEIRNAGFNILPCKKGKDSVTFGITSVRGFKTHVLKGSTHIIKEKQSYKWKEDKDGVVLAGKFASPVKFHDHLMDAERYAITHICNTVVAGFSVAKDIKHEITSERYEIPELTESVPVKDEDLLDSDVGWVAN